MKVQVEISNETMVAVMDGKRVEGALRLQLASTGTHSEVGFKAYSRKAKKRKKDEIVKQLEHGWVKASAKRFKVYNSIPKKIGVKRVVKVLERETKIASDAIIDYELIERV